jgi:hypothetical protein
LVLMAHHLARLDPLSHKIFKVTKHFLIWATRP